MKIRARNLWLAFTFLGALPFGLALSLLYFLLKLTVRFGPLELAEPIPARALFFFSHPQVYGIALNPYTKRRGPYPTYVFGYHGFLPYIWVVNNFFSQIVYVLFDPTRRRSAQVLEILNRYPDRHFSIATDSGGPYGKVRSSLAKLSVESGRPLVGMRVVFCRAVTIHWHQIPLPGSRIQIQFLPVIWPEKLRAMPEPQATALLQERMDFMTGTPFNTPKD